ncbi:hypothetical protein JTM28_37105, partial [Pseudomonas aeruginosa]|nr:hypothetical protein [Pseudomonas aeruginosa]
LRSTADNRKRLFALRLVIPAGLEPWRANADLLAFPRWNSARGLPSPGSEAPSARPTGNKKTALEGAALFVVREPPQRRFSILKKNILVAWRATIL